MNIRKFELPRKKKGKQQSALLLLKPSVFQEEKIQGRMTIKDFQGRLTHSSSACVFLYLLKCRYEFRKYKSPEGGGVKEDLFQGPRCYGSIKCWDSIYSN